MLITQEVAPPQIHHISTLKVHSLVANKHLYLLASFFKNHYNFKNNKVEKWDINFKKAIIAFLSKMNWTVKYKLLQILDLKMETSPRDFATILNNNGKKKLNN